MTENGGVLSQDDELALPKSVVLRWRDQVKATHHRLSERSASFRIGTAMATVGLFTLLVAASGVFRDFVVAKQFGTGPELDAFLIAFVLPTFAITVIAGALTAAFMPPYVRVREQEGDDAAQQLLASTVALAGAALLVGALLLASAGYVIFPLIASGFGADQLALARRLYLLAVPVVVIKGVATVWATVLNAGERFAIVAVAPALVPLCAIGALLLGGRSLGIYSLSLGVLVGYLTEAVVLAVALRKRGHRLRPVWHGMTQPMREVVQQYAPMVAGALLMGSTAMVDQAMAAALEPGSVSVLHYGSKLVALVLSVGSLALGSALFPHYSRLVALRDWSAIRETVRTYGTLVALASVPLLVVFVALGEPLVGMLFERGAFSDADTVKVARVHALYSAQIPFYLLGTLLVRLLSSLGANHILMWGSAISLGLNVVLNYTFARWFGVAGIALSTSVVYLCSFCFAAMMLARRMRQLTEGNNLAT